MEKNLLSEFPEIAKEWDYKKNEKGPQFYAPHSNKKVWWICSVCGNNWGATVNNRTGAEKSGCPICSEKNRIDSYKEAWQVCYEHAREYYLTYGNLLVPDKYITLTGFKLGGWIAQQRKVYKGKKAGILLPEQIKLLEEIGMVWDVLEMQWNEYYLLAAEYYREHGNLLIPKQYISSNGKKVGVWITTQRKAYKGTTENRLTQNKIQMLEEIGMIWELRNPNQWYENYEYAKRYYQEHGDLLIPKNFMTDTGINLGGWIRVQRQAYKGNVKNKISSEQVKLLNSIGMCWEVMDEIWMGYYSLAKEYYSIHNDLMIPISYVTESGIKLGRWIQRLRRAYTGKGKERITEEQIKLLNQIGMVWDAQTELILQNWSKYYGSACDYFEQHGDLLVPSRYVTETGIPLGEWIGHQRSAYNGVRGDITPDRIELLDKIGMIWNNVPTPKSTSFPEWIIKSVCEKKYGEDNVLYRHKVKGKELDVYVPKYNLAFEYDGLAWHGDKKDKDEAKDAMCEKNGISLFRIREAGLPKLKKNKAVVIVEVDTHGNLKTMYYVKYVNF